MYKGYAKHTQRAVAIKSESRAAQFGDELVRLFFPTVIDLEDAEDEIEDIQVRCFPLPFDMPSLSSGSAQTEISILSSLDSPFVTKYEGSWLRGTELWIVMEYLSGGSCGDLLKAGTFKEEYIAIVLRELLKGLEYLHGEGKLHRDIKGELRALTRAGVL